MLEIGSRWMDKSKGWRDITAIAEIATVTEDGDSKLYYRMDKYWPFLTEEEVLDKYLPVVATTGEPHSAKR